MKRDFFKILLIAILPSCILSCVDNIPQEEVLPRDAVSFEYYINQNDDPLYYLDFYTDSYITFVNTSPKTTAGSITWDFGDGVAVDADKQGKDTITHFYSTAGTYKVKLTIGDYSKEQVIMIAPIKPIVTINMSDSICEVRKTLVDFVVELPNPQNKPATFLWTFPADTKDADGNEVTTFESDSPNDVPKELQFSHVGSQSVKLSVTLGGAALEDAVVNVQVGYNQKVPTLYYAVQGGRIMAYKLTDGTGRPEDMIVNPFDLGVASGQHPFTLLFKDTLLYVLDAGKQFYYVNDVNSVLGDGKISVIAKDGSKVQTMISNAGQAAFDDPFYGCIDGDFLYYTNRNTGIIKVPLKDRDKVYNTSEYPYYVNHNTLGYYNNGWGYGAIGGTVAKINGIWHWAKFYNGNGIYRFQDTDILGASIAAGDDTNKPKDGIMVEAYPKTFVYCSKSATPTFCFFCTGESYNGLYAGAYTDVAAIDNPVSQLANFEKKFIGADGLEKSFKANLTGNMPSVEGSGSEAVGICQMAYDEKNDCVYFGFRNNSAASNLYPPTGIYRYSIANDKVDCLIEGVSVYGLVVNNEATKLF